MRTRRAVSAALENRLPLALALVIALALVGPATSVAAPAPSVLTFKTVEVGAPGNPSVGIVPVTNAVYSSCAEVVPAEKQPPCQQVGAVGYPYGIGQLEVTVAQYVAFLNTADPAGRNKHKLYSSTESGAEWPKYGQIDFSAGAPTGHHYSIASPEWADKPYGFANFLRSARFANSLYNGRVLSKQRGTAGSFQYVTYRLRLSRQTEVGMYDMTVRAMTRSHKTGFVIPTKTSGSRRPTTTPTAAASTPTGNTRPTRAPSATKGRAPRTRRSWIPTPVTSPTPPNSRWRTSTLPKRLRRAGVPLSSAAQPARA